MQLTEGCRDPEDRLIDETDRSAKKDKMLDKTIADTFPASDPPSSLPDPDEDSFAARSVPHEWEILSKWNEGAPLDMRGGQ